LEELAIKRPLPAPRSMAMRMLGLVSVFDTNGL